MKKILAIFSFLSTLAIFGQTIPTNGLVAHYPFNGNADDASSSGLNGTVSGATLTTDRFGNLNSAYEFNGGQRISVTHSSQLNPSSSGFTISVWVNIYEGFNVGDIIRKGSDQFNDNYGIRYHEPAAYPNYGAGISTKRNSVDYTASFSSPSKNQWHHLVAIYDGTKLKYYLNNVLKSESATISATNPVYNNTSTFDIGSTNYSFKGKIDDIAIYNRALTLEEINNLYSGQNQNQSDTVLVYSASHTFGASWRDDWTVNPSKRYLLKVTGTFGVAGGQPEFDAAFRLASPNLPIDGFWSASFKPKRPDNDIYTVEHTYNYSLNAPDGLIWIGFSDNVYSDNSGTLNFYLYQLPDETNPVFGGEWKMQINISVQGLTDQLNYAGVDSLATEGYDASFDTPNPPTPPGNYIDAYFYHPEWNSPLGSKFASDVKKSTDLADTVKRWFFEVETNVLNDTVKLLFTQENVPTKFGKYLTDMQTGKRVDLRYTDTYKYYNTSSLPRKFMLIVGDSTAPQISNLIPKGDEIWRSNTQKPVSWTMSDGTGIDSVFLYASNNNGTNFNPFASIGNISNYNWTIPQEYLNNGYRVKAFVRDSLGNMNEIVSPLAFTVVGDSLQIQSLAEWNLTGTSLLPNDTTLTAIFGDDLVSSPYFVWGYTLSTGYTLPLGMSFGTGYWLGLLNNHSWDVRGTAVESDSIPQPLTLGYNLVGTKYVREVSKDRMTFVKSGNTYNFNQAVTAGLISNAIFAYNGSGYVEEDTLSLFGGYWLGVLQEGVTLYQKPVSTATPVNKVNQEPELFTENNWRLKLHAESGIQSDNITEIGVTETATAGYDVEYDAARPPVPPVDKFIEIYSEVSGTGYPQFLGNRYARDFKDIPNWTMKVNKGNTGSNEVTIRWNKNELLNLPEGIRITMTDLTTGQTIDMRRDSSYTFTYSEERTFQINGTATGIDDETLTPTNFSLSQNYPNPFNPTTKLRYSLPEESRVKITVYNSLGEMVRTLTNETSQSGWYETTFDATQIPSGIYFAKIEAQSTGSSKQFTQTIKMLLIK